MDSWKQGNRLSHYSVDRMPAIIILIGAFDTTDWKSHRRVKEGEYLIWCDRINLHFPGEETHVDWIRNWQSLRKT